MHTMQDMQYIHYMYNMLYMHDMYNMLNMHDMQNMLICIIWTPPHFICPICSICQKICTIRTPPLSGFKIRKII